jgi:hypothetical protein
LSMFWGYDVWKETLYGSMYWSRKNTNHSKSVILFVNQLSELVFLEGTWIPCWSSELLGIKYRSSLTLTYLRAYTNENEGINDHPQFTLNLCNA